MPRFQPGALKQIGYKLLQAAGCSREDAKTVADHLVESNLFGHDSHGVIRLQQYLRFMREGRFKPQGVPRVVMGAPSTAVVDAGGALGQVGATFAVRLAMEKARKYGTATVALRNTSHVGRVGAYPLLAAREGMIGVMFVNAGKLGYQIAPFGGIDGRLSTNPIAFAAPRRDAEPIMVDLATSVVAEGKIRLAINQGKHVPEGWIIDHQGRSTIDPKDFTGDPPGAILPLGGIASHKGYALSFIVEVLGGALSGEGCAAGEREMKSNGVLLTVYHIEHFVELDAYYNQLEMLVKHVKSSRTASGFSEILVPGEPEFKMARVREQEGIEVDDTTWGHICDEAQALGVDLDYLPTDG